MAANKLHLKNVDKDYKLKKTDKVTSAGRPVYINTKTGEEHSEISVTLEMPEGSGNWINVPSLINGRVYNLQGVLDMLRAGKIEPNSTGHATEEIAVEAAKARSASLQPNIGQTLKPANNEIALAQRGISTDSNGIQRDAIGRIIEYQPSGPHVGEPTPVVVDDMGAAMSDQMNQELASTYPTEEENPDGLFVVNDDNYIDLVHSQAARIAAQENQGELDAKAANERASLERMYQIMDRAQSEKDDSYFYNPDNPDLNTPWKNWNAKYRMGDMLRGTGLKGAENPTMNRYTQTPVSAEDQAMFDKAKSIRFPGNEDANFDSNTVYDMGVSDDGIFPGFPKYNAGPLRRSSKGISSKDNESFDIPILGNDVVTNSNKQSTTNKTSKSIGSYYDDMPPAEKMKDNRSLKGLTPDYGEMPGFKKAKDGNYWSADENSEFWKTDAGYQKAVETWGASGNPLPAYVKKPARKELDVQAIKNFFKPNR
jgi:hypothetical protein